jgi:hypothetical protein
VPKGWIEFEYEGQGVVRFEAGSCVYQPPAIRHRELGHSDDVEMLEIVMPSDFKTEEVASGRGVVSVNVTQPFRSASCGWISYSWKGEVVLPCS